MEDGIFCTRKAQSKIVADDILLFLLLLLLLLLLLSAKIRLDICVNHLLGMTLSRLIFSVFFNQNVACYNVLFAL